LLFRDSLRGYKSGQKEEMKKAKKETKNVPLFVDNNSDETK
jgi:hypothetical protein